MPFTLPEWAGGKTVSLNSSGLLFVCAGAFEGLYDAVFHRVTAGRDKGALQTTTVVEAGRVREELQFKLRDWLSRIPRLAAISKYCVLLFDAVCDG